MKKHKENNITLVLPMNPLKKETGGMTALYNHLIAFNEISCTEITKLCMVYNSSASCEKDETDLREKFPDLDFKFMHRRYGDGVLSKISMYINYFTSTLPYDVLRRETTEKEIEIKFLSKSRLVIFDHLYSMPYFLKKNESTTNYIYIAHNIESEIVKERKNHAASFFKKILWSIDHLKTKRFESNSLKKSNVNVFISQADSDYYNGSNKCTSTESIPPKTSGRWKYTNSRELIFIGETNYHPNFDAISWLRWSLLPEINKIDKSISINIIGKADSLSITNMSSENFKFSGFLSQNNFDSKLSNCGLMISPVDLGSGIKIKLIECLARGVPVIATSPSIRGLEKIKSIKKINRSKPDLAAKICIDLLNNRNELEDYSHSLSVDYDILNSENVSLAKIIESRCKI